ncbi:MAG: alginate lyase family protein [Bacteroidales bacterium]|nr:alginate lyase family protein [Bacteroidales bacterium]MBN2757437.1 alginate lyase family protein [Bacteroidales bacterium]
MKKISLFMDFIKNMGIKYILFRIFYLFKSKTGLLKIIFPTPLKLKKIIELEDWKNQDIPFFFNSKEDLLSEKKIEISENNLKLLLSKVENIHKGIFTFFSSIDYKIDKNWHQNPDSKYTYDKNIHWSKIEDFSEKAGDIKFVWEKARFTFIYDLIRYDYHFKSDQSKFVFSEIESFIDENPINLGPNYKCSQEISLRILNWTFALNYYKNSTNLTDEIFQKIINSIYWQLKHVYKNINFSRISVRNNHAITETLMIFLSNMLFPFIYETKSWSKKGKKWFEKEIEYQIYEDGTYLQHSHNYHRVVIQLITWAIKLSELNNKKLNKKVYEKAKKSVEFLISQQENKTGFLPNYGMNDGALFFPLNSEKFRNYKPQIQALANALDFSVYNQTHEDTFWYGLNNSNKKNIENNNSIIIKFSNGGYFGFKDNALTTTRCATYKDRPAQSDALNIDIWYNGINIIRDPGTYKYNTDKKYIDFYHGTIGHNTLTIGNNSQMQKGGRFIWFYWTKVKSVQIFETDNSYIFEGEIIAFPIFGSNITHKRKVIKHKNQLKWEIIDQTNYQGKELKYLHWNINPEFNKYLNIETYDKTGNTINNEYITGWYSELYGQKEKVNQLIFKTESNYIKTIIQINS